MEVRYFLDPDTGQPHKRRMKKQEFPPGWNEQRVKDVIANYENQTEDEEAADIEAALEAEDSSLMAIPTELVPDVRALLARKRSA